MITEKIELGTDEHILTLVRKHWFIVGSHFAYLAILALLPLLILPLLTAHIEPTAAYFAEYASAAAYTYSVWLLILWLSAFNAWTNHYLDVWIVTNKRLIAVNQRGLFSRTTGSFRLERLQDLNVEVEGMIATLLHFGTLEAQTAGGSEEEFRASGLPNPRELKALILKAADERIDVDNTGI